MSSSYKVFVITSLKNTYNESSLYIRLTIDRDGLIRLQWTNSLTQASLFDTKEEAKEVLESYFGTAYNKIKSCVIDEAQF